ncbi:hypothetical protein B0H19DRAFT_1385412 [Mycena capillaripes]|nr:hypothetical protein B0H19DRAFT_1385412 [Mycena capillaripes]
MAAPTTAPNLVPTIESTALPATPADEWAQSTNDILEAHPKPSTPGTPGPPIPGSFSDPPAPDQSREGAETLLDSAKSYLPAQDDVQRVITNAGQKAKAYLPQSVVSYLPSANASSNDSNSDFELEPPHPPFASGTNYGNGSNLSNLSTEVQVGSPPVLSQRGSASTLSVQASSNTGTGANTSSTNVHTGGSASPHPFAPPDTSAFTRTATPPPELNAFKSLDGLPTPPVSSSSHSSSYVSSPAMISDVSSSEQSEGIPAPPNSKATTFDSDDFAELNSPNVLPPPAVQRILGPHAFAGDAEARDRDRTTLAVPERGSTPSPVDGHAPSPLSPVRDTPPADVHNGEGHPPAGGIDADTHVHPLPPTPANAYLEGGGGVHVPDVPRTPDSAFPSNNDADAGNNDADARVHPLPPTPANAHLEGGGGVHVPDVPRTPDSARRSNNDADAGNSDADARVHPLPPTPANAYLEGGSGVHVPDVPRTPDSARRSNNDADAGNSDADAHVHTLPPTPANAYLEGGSGVHVPDVPRTPDSARRSNNDADACNTDADTRVHPLPPTPANAYLEGGSGVHVPDVPRTPDSAADTEVPDKTEMRGKEEKTQKKPKLVQRLKEKMHIGHGGVDGHS